jgi:hypothetical protein
VRVAYDPTTQIRGPAEVIPNLRDFLLREVAELKGEGEKPGIQGGLNIEGIAWDPARERLLLGLRSPIPDGQALIIALKLRDPRGPLSLSNLQLATPHPIQLPLGGQGIRDLHFDSRLKAFLIISGMPETMPKADFKLWEWSGNSESARPQDELREEATLDSKMKPEGITHVSINGKDFVFIVGDASKYLKLDYLP